MTRAHFLLAAFVAICVGAAAGLFGGPALGQDARPQGEPAMRGFMQQLSDGQRMMYFAQMQKKTEGLSDDQRRAVRMQEREKLSAMSDSERQQFASDLQAKWDALSPADQAEIRSRAAAFRAERMKRGRDADKPE